MPKYVKNNRTVKEIMDEIQNERERNPELNEKMGKYEKMFQGWYQEHFAKLYRADLGFFDSYIQMGGTSLHEILKDRYTDKDHQITILSALAASMEMENKKDTFQIFLPDGKGNVKPRPIVNSENVISSPKKAEISLWDSFCNLLGYKTEKYKAYEAQKKQEEMQKQLEKDQAELAKEEILNDAKEGSERAEKILRLVEARAEFGTPGYKNLLRTLFGKENVGDWKLSDGTRLSPVAVLMGVLESKEVGEPGLSQAVLEDDPGLEHMAEKYPEKWEKACKICHNLAEKKEKTAELNKKFHTLNEFLFGEKQSEYSKKMEEDLLKHLIPHESANYDLMSDREDKLDALDGSGQWYHIYYQWIQAKGQLHKFLKDEKLALSPEEEIVKEGIYQASLVKKTEQALEDEDYEKAGQLNGRLIKSQVYSDSLRRIVATQMQQASNGKEVTALTAQDMKRLKRLIEIKVEGTDLTEDKRPLSVIKTSSMAIQGVTSKYLKMDITLDDKFGLKKAVLKTAVLREELDTSENILRCFEENSGMDSFDVVAEIDGELVEQRNMMQDNTDINKDYDMDYEMDYEMDSDMEYDEDDLSL